MLVVMDYYVNAMPHVQELIKNRCRKTFGFRLPLSQWGKASVYLSLDGRLSVVVGHFKSEKGPPSIHQRRAGVVLKPESPEVHTRI